jgi:NADPH-dependent ferric siderophore reductase
MSLLPLKKKPARLLTVQRAKFLTPNMRRITFAGPELAGIPTDRVGGNCKIMLPEPGETREHFANRLSDGPAPVRRTFTVRAIRSDPLELDIDFVAHGTEGPASRWALEAEAGSFLGFAGPSASKVIDFVGDWYLVAADPSALPVAAATLEAMPRDAKGIAIFEVTHEDDRQTLDAPEGIDIRWLVHPDPKQPSNAQEQLIRSLDWPTGRVQTCIAGESAVIRSLRAFLHQEKQLPRSDTYISGYWKIGLVEDQHQVFKKTQE